MLPISNNPNSSQGGDFVTDLKDWWNRTPLFVRFTVYVTITLYVLSFPISSLPSRLANKPYYIISGFEYYRLLTSPFVVLSLLEMLFVFLAYLPMAAVLERKIGTIRTIIDFTIKNLEINISFILVCLLIYFIFPGILMLPCYGLWSIFFSHLTQRCMQDPEGVSMLLCLPIQIKTKYYPYFLILLFSLLSGSPRIDMILGALVGYLHTIKFDAKFFSFFNDARIARWEQYRICSFCRFFPSFASVSNSAPDSSTSNIRSNYNQAPTNQSTQSSPFGGKGIQIGGTDTSSAGNARNTNPNAYHELQNIEEDTHDDHQLIHKLIKCF